MSKEYVSKNFASLVQIRINGGYKKFIKEAFILLKINPKIIVNLKFYFYLIILHFPIVFIEELKYFHKKYSIKFTKLNNIVE